MTWVSKALVNALAEIDELKTDLAYYKHAHRSATEKTERLQKELVAARAPTAPDPIAWAADMASHLCEREAARKEIEVLRSLLVPTTEAEFMASWREHGAGPSGSLQATVDGVLSGRRRRAGLET